MLQRICNDIWSHESEVSLGRGMRMPTRTTVIRLAQDRLLVHSPLAIDDRLAKEIDAIGDVHFLVAPNCLHWLFLKSAKERYPDARVYGAPGLEKKLGRFFFEPLPATGHLDGVGEDLRIERIEGAPFMAEHAFLHPRSRTLIVTDLVFNLHRCKGVWMNLFLRLVGAHDKLGQSRVWRWLVKDRAAAAKSLAHVFQWDFDRMTMAHGAVVEVDARVRALAALSWMRGESPARLGPRSTSE